MFLQAAINGALTKSDHHAIPVTVDEIVADAAACFAVGASSIHVHARDAAGRETFDPEVVNSLALRVKARAAVEVSLTTGAWIEPDLERRLDLIRSWRAPDCATVNLSEDGCLQVAETLAQSGIGIEVGISTLADVETLRNWPPLPLHRLAIEPIELPAEGSDEYAEAIHGLLDCVAVNASRLQHGDGEATWPLIRHAASHDLATRVGFEDTLKLPNGTIAATNAELVRAAAQIWRTTPRATTRRS